VAASLGDPLAAGMDAWVADNPPRATTVDLERALAARGWARRVAGATAVVALTIDGARREITIQPGEPVSLSLTPAQATSARLEPVSGSALVVQAWEDRLVPGSLRAEDGLAFGRLVQPSGTIAQTDTVIVTLNVSLPDGHRTDCWRVVDTVPSGLAPVSGVTAMEGEWVGETPISVDGQRVEFCVGTDPTRNAYELRYVARVITPGTYTWEPAVLQAAFDPGVGVVLARTTVTIAGATR
jgi:hypothetical protein